MNTQTLRLSDEADRMQERLAGVEADIEDVLQEVDELDEDEDGYREKYDELELEYDVLESTRVTLEGYIQTIEKHMEEWDGNEVVLKELTAAEARMTYAKAEREAEQNGFDELPDGLLELKMMEQFVVSTPPGAPDPSDIGNLSDRMFGWLYARGDALNTVGDIDMGNLSLRERMTERRS